MTSKLVWMGVLLSLLHGATGCSRPNPNVRVRHLPDKRLQVEGPLAGPFKTREALAESACTLMTQQPGAASGEFGVEYCALHYYSARDDAFFLSYLSDVGGALTDGTKFCIVPSSLDDPGNPDVVILGGAHTHPHNRRFSSRDMSVRTHWNPTRIVDKKTGRAFHRELLMFYREKAGECRAYSYNNVTRIVSSLRGGEWVPIGQVTNETGSIRLLEGQDWVP